MDLILCAAAAFSVAVSVYGTARLFKRKEPLYFKMIVCANWCYTAQILYQLCLLVCVGSDGSYGDSVLSGLGLNAYAAFVFAANYGPFDSIIDAGNNKYKKTRFIAFASPVLFLALTAVVIVLWSNTGEKLIEIIGYMLISCSIMPWCVYYNFKYLLINEDDPFIRGVRPVNLCSLLFCFAAIGEIIAKVQEHGTIADIFMYVMILLSAATVFAADWGRRKWRS